LFPVIPACPETFRRLAKNGVERAARDLDLDVVSLGLDKTQHPFEMNGKDIKTFTDLTDKLKKAAKKP